MRFLQAGSIAGVFSAVGALASASSFQNNTYDYIVVGGGPSGIITAERFAEAGKKVLLLERGTGPTVSTGANETLSWDHSRTVIDLPGLSGDIGNLPQYEESLCDDTAGSAGCVLGGGVTLNYMVFVHPPDHDFDNKWPHGWKSNDVSSAADRLYKRNPGTILPSSDGKRYDQTMYTVLSNFFKTLGWKSVDMLQDPNSKHQIYSYPAWNIKNQMRAGPVRTYLPLTKNLPNFTLKLNTKVLRLVRSGSKVTGVEIQNPSGKTEIISTGPAGRVVLAAGSLSTPRVLFNSGIGPQAQIKIARISGVTVPPQRDWLNLPVGVGLKDHPMFVVNVQTKNDTIGPLDFEGIVNGTDTADISLYRQGSGVLTQGKHRLIFFTSNTVDGYTRYYQGSCAPGDENGVVSITAYMTHGLTSSGVLGINEKGSTVIEKSPYLQTAGDRKAATQFFQQLLDDINMPSSGFQVQGSTNVSAILETPYSGTHYVGSAKMGAQDGTSVVDTNTKVYGVDNLVRALLYRSSMSWVVLIGIWVYSTLSMEVSTPIFQLVIAKQLSWLLLRLRLRGSLDIRTSHPLISKLKNTPSYLLFYIKLGHAESNPASNPDDHVSSIKGHCSISASSS